MKRCDNMSKKKKSNMVLPELLDAVFAINHEMIEDNGEDCCFYSFNEYAGILAVFDGCGGLGASKYSNFWDKTGAFMASRTAAYSLKKWFDEACECDHIFSDNSISSIKSSIQKELEKFNNKTQAQIKLKGSMIRPFPTTLAAALIEQKGNRIKTQTIWAGDSRVYALTANGLFQLSEDDLDGEDAYTNLTSDGVLTNLISADGNYKIHALTNYFDMPCIIFTATDGCFGYLLTPMHFEFLLLICLQEAANMTEWKNNIEKVLCEVSGDDFTMCLAAFGFETFNKLKESFLSRTDYLNDHYIQPIDEAPDDKIVDFWNKYKDSYYSMLNRREAKNI